MNTSIRSYSILRTFPTFEERYQYLCLSGLVGEQAFGFDRYLNQRFYKSREWLQARNVVIVRDNACDLGIPEYDIRSRVVIHHMNVVTIEDLEQGNEIILNPEYLVCTTEDTHLAIHYGNKNRIQKAFPIIRRPHDTSPWRQFKEV